MAEFKANKRSRKKGVGCDKAGRRNTKKKQKKKTAKPSGERQESPLLTSIYSIRQESMKSEPATEQQEEHTDSMFCPVDSSE